MKKFLFTLLLILSGVTGGYAAGSPLEEAFSKICKVPIGREVPREHIAQLIWELESKIRFKDGSVRISGPNLPMQQLQEDFYAVREITDRIPSEMLRICSFNDFNNFSFYTANDSKDGIREVLIIWMSATTGSMTIWHCTMTDEMIEQMQAGELTMNYYGTKLSPMPEYMLNILKNCGNQ